MRCNRSVVVFDLTPDYWHSYHSLYLKSKGNVYKNKRQLVDAIHLLKAEATRTKNLSDQMEVRRVKSTTLSGCHFAFADESYQEQGHARETSTEAGREERRHCRDREGRAKGRSTELKSSGYELMFLTGVNHCISYHHQIRS